MEKFSNILRTVRTIAYEAGRKFYRNALALIKRFVRAVRHRDADEITLAVAAISTEALWLLMWACAVTCLVAGFFKPHCFVTAAFFVIIATILRDTTSDIQSSVWEAYF